MFARFLLNVSSLSSTTGEEARVTVWYKCALLSKCPNQSHSHTGHGAGLLPSEKWVHGGRKEIVLGLALSWSAPPPPRPRQSSTLKVQAK